MIRLSRFSWKASAPWLAALAFFAALLVTGLVIYRDYGIGWDEPAQLNIGIQTYRYVMRGDPSLLSFRDRYYGPFFEILLIILQAKGPSQAVYYSRHLLTFLCFYAGCLGFFAFARRLTRNTWLALMGTVFLALSPRIFADAFYNSKDIPFMVFYTLNLFSLLILLERPGWLTALLHGLLTAAMLAIRLPGLVILAMTIGGLAIECMAGRLSWKRGAGLGGLYLLVSLALMVAFWPALWPDPLNALAQAFQTMKNFPHPADMLYFGQTISSETLPWHYVLAWIGITTPVVYLVFILGGLGIILARWLRNPRRVLAPEGRGEWILIAGFLLPLLSVIALRSTLYNGWRQMYFIYPPLLMLSLWGVEGLRRWFAAHFDPQAVTEGLVGMLVIAVFPIASWMVANHPIQNVYFNGFAGPDIAAIRSRFPVDYWGLSYRQALAYIVQTDADERIPIYAESNGPGWVNVAIFPTPEGTRLNIVTELSQAKYYIGDYTREKSYPFKNQVYAVKVNGEPVLAVYLLSEDEKQ